MEEQRTAPATVVVIEDEPQIRRFVRTALETEGCHVFEADRGERGLVEAGTRKPDLVILDLGLPDRDGVDVVRDLRTWSAVPVLILSARVDETDKVAALDAGADDYLTKLVSFGEVTVDLARRQVTRSGSEVHLTPIEYRLLALLIANAGRVLTHRQLLREVWGPSHAEDTHYLRVYMTGLRRKLEANPTQPRHIRTESGVGYRLVLEA